MPLARWTTVSPVRSRKGYRVTGNFRGCGLRCCGLGAARVYDEALSYSRPNIAGKPLVWQAGLVTGPGDEVQRVGTEYAVENFVFRHREGEKEPHRCAFFSEHRGGGVQSRDHVIDRLLRQLGQVPLGQVIRRLPGGVHTAER
jgi:hypothetical protein